MDHMLTKEQGYVLLVAESLGPTLPSQFRRLLFEPPLLEDFDLMQALYELKCDGLLEQMYSPLGIRYGLTPAGVQALSDKRCLVNESDLKRFHQQAEKYALRFAREKDYPAQYTEQATEVFPVFLSIRKGDKVLLHLDLIADREETAQAITRNWLDNADRTLRLVWESIAPGIDCPFAQQ